MQILSQDTSQEIRNTLLNINLKRKFLEPCSRLKYKDKAFLIQDKDQSVFNKKNLKFVTKRKPSKKEKNYFEIKID